MSSPAPSTGELIACDPSKRSPGVALFREGKLVAAARIKVPDAPASRYGMGLECVAAAQLVAEWAVSAQRARPAVLVIEWPQVYRAAKSKGDPNDLLPVSGMGVGLAAALTVALATIDLNLDVLSPTPAEWIGQLPKTMVLENTSHRGRRRMPRKGEAKLTPRGNLINLNLEPAERALLPDQHDAIDAVGLGLWALGRLNRRPTNAEPAAAPRAPARGTRRVRR